MLIAIGGLRSGDERIEALVNGDGEAVESAVGFGCGDLVFGFGWEASHEGVGVGQDS